MIRGVIPVLPTPVTETEDLDIDGVRRLIEYLLRYDLGGLWILGSAGEEMNLNEKTRLQFTKAVVDAVRGRVPVIAGAIISGTRNTIDLLKKICDQGPNAVFVNFLHKAMSDDHFVEFFCRVADASPKPVFLYNNMGRGADPSIKAIKEISRHPNIRGMKMGGVDMWQHYMLLNTVQNESFTVITAGGEFMLACLMMGAIAHTAIPIAAFPAHFARLHELIQQGEIKRAMVLQARLAAFLNRMPDIGNSEINAQIKCVLEIKDVIGRHCTAPFRRLSDEHKSEIAALLEELSLADDRVVD